MKKLLALSLAGLLLNSIKADQKTITFENLTPKNQGKLFSAAREALICALSKNTTCEEFQKFKDATLIQEKQAFNKKDDSEVNQKSFLLDHLAEIETLTGFEYFFRNNLTPITDKDHTWWPFTLLNRDYKKIVATITDEELRVIFNEKIEISDKKEYLCALIRQKIEAQKPCSKEDLEKIIEEKIKNNTAEIKKTIEEAFNPAVEEKKEESETV